MEEKPKGPGAFEQAAREAEAEVKRALEFIEARVVPKARRDGEKILRRISEELDHWADHLHDSPGASSPGPPPGPPPEEDKK
ncbi:MAG TPA: hypothetical protein VEU62_03240 [Bryobacterales bacterium]|nr:hypothetical protein [Bryobacterales bacterium]